MSPGHAATSGGGARRTGVRVVLSIVAAALVAAAFGAFVATRAIHTHVTAASYFQGSLDASRVYARIYDEVLTDPGFAPQADVMLGGVNVDRDQVIAAVRQVIKPAYLQDMTNEAVARVVDHFERGVPLDLALDITQIVDHIDEIALAAAAQVLPRIPVRRAASLEAYAQQLQLVIGLMQGRGELPDALPSYPVPPEYQDEVVQVLIVAAELSPSRPDDAAVIAEVRAAIAADDTPRAVRASTAGLLHRLITRSVDLLIHDPHVTRITRDDGVHYLLAPSQDVTRRIERKLGWIGRINQAAGRTQVVAAIAFVAGLAGLIMLWRGRRRLQRLWVGAALAVAGVLGFAGWAYAHAVSERALTGYVDSRKKLPATLKAILDDVVGESLGALTPSIWIPSIAAMVLGATLIAAGAFTSPARSR